MGQRRRTRRSVLAVAAALALGATAATTTASASAPEPAGGTLTVDTSFILQSLDPARTVTPTMTIATRAMYDTLLRAHGEDTTPQPWVAESFEASDDATEYTFHLRDDVVFADGTPLTSADVVWSFNRLANLQLGGSYLIEGITPSAPDEHTVVLTSETPNPAIPVIVATPAFAILNSALVTENGGTDGPDAPEADSSETWFNSNSAGSGPYVLESYQTDDSVILARNPNWWGDTLPDWDRVVIRNMPAATQLLNVQRGQFEIAIDLSATQAQSLEGNSDVVVRANESPNLFRVQMNMDDAASATSSNPHIQEAVRYAINYEAMVQLGGVGSVQAAGLLPTVVAGSLPIEEATQQDVERAIAAVEASGIENPSLTMSYPSDINVNGIQFATFAQRVAADLEEVGISVELEALPVTTYLDEWRTGQMEMTLTYSYPDFMDPTSFAGYLPGGSDAVRAGWQEGADPELEALGAEMSATVDDAERAALAQDIQRRLNEAGPYMPLLQTAQAIVSTSDLTNVVLDPSWTLDVAAVEAA